MTIYSTTNWQNEERIAIARVIRASNVESMARHRARGEAQRQAALAVPSAQRLRCCHKSRCEGIEIKNGSTGCGATAPRVTELTVPEVMPLIHVRAVVGEVRVGDAPRVVHLFFSLAGRLLGYFDPYLGPVTSVQQAAVLYAHRDGVCHDMAAFDVMCDA